MLCREKNPKDANHRPLEDNWERVRGMRLEDGTRLVQQRQVAEVDRGDHDAAAGDHRHQLVALIVCPRLCERKHGPRYRQQLNAWRIAGP